MNNVRLIARLDIKGSNLIKGIHLEGFRVIGAPHEYALKYYSQGADELIYMDCVASLYGRNHLSNIVSKAASDIFIPMTVGGGIRSVEDVTDLLMAGADKVAVNTAAIGTPDLINNIANRFGSQCIVVSVEAKQVGLRSWEAYTNNGREKTGKEVVVWVKEAVSRGAGEILLTSVDQEGVRKGFDIDLVNAVSSAVSVPVIASGGMGRLEDVTDAVMNGGADAVAMASILHYNTASVGDVRDAAIATGLQVRKYEPR
ncbi:imidazole glycerol phosphate synthase cyclase subunit [Burkholderiales bacterium]|nr:imidazole glycerol phosphate synthase cyclase subunit [Burkholderiales bacterium]